MRLERPVVDVIAGTNQTNYHVIGVRIVSVDNAIPRNSTLVQSTQVFTKREMIDNVPIGPEPVYFVLYPLRILRRQALEGIWMI